MKKIFPYLLFTFIAFSCTEKKDAHLLLRQAQQEMGKENYKNAELKLVEAIKADSAFDSAYFLLGSLKLQIAQYDEAIKHFNRAIELNPQYAEAYNNRALCNGVVGNLEEEKSDLDKALEINPKNHHAWYNRGNYWLDHNKFEQAIEDYNKAIELIPDYSNAFFNRAEAKFNLNDHTGSYSDYSVVTRLTPDDGEAWFELGNCCKELDSLGKACIYWKKAVELGFTDAKNAIKKNCSEE